MYKRKLNIRSFPINRNIAACGERLCADGIRGDRTGEVGTSPEPGTGGSGFIFGFMLLYFYTFRGMVLCNESSPVFPCQGNNINRNIGRPFPCSPFRGFINSK
jgi:hypothetical protein